MLKHSLLRRKLGGSLSAWALNTLGPSCVFLARRVIKKIETRDDFYEIEFKNVPGKLFVPSSTNLHDIYQIIAEQFYSWNWHQYQIPETTISPDDYVFDCGSAEGLIPFLNHRRAKKIICFEPLDDFRRGLAKTFHDVTNVIIVPEALGERPETVYFTENIDIASAISSQPTKIQINVSTIDLYCQATDYPMNYLKSDVEGYDLKLLKGAAETIRKYRPKIAITTYHASTHAAEMKDFLLSLIPDYHIITKGIACEQGNDVMLHAW